MLLTAIPINLILIISTHYASLLYLFLFKILFENAFSNFSYDAWGLWSAYLEAYRELFSIEFPRALAAVIALSACHGLIAGEFSAIASALAVAGDVFVGAFLAFTTVAVAVISVAVAGYMGYQAISRWINAMNENNLNDARDDEPETGLTPP